MRKLREERSLNRSLLSDLSDFVAERLGLHFPEARWTDLQRGVAATARELGMPDAESAARSILSGSLPRSEVDVLASHLTIGETYFFREKESLDLFEQQIVPDLMRARQRGERHLRIWSAGCCTGEEPYSIAMILDRLIPEGEGWNVTILGTDINPRFLRKASEAIYGEWSFRSTPGWIRERYFRKRRDGSFELSPAIRNRVTFSYLNLADDVVPSLVSQTNAMDAIFCRNVLMYFTEERARQVSWSLYRALVPGGWLIAGLTEVSSTLFSHFSPVRHPGAVLYRKSETTTPPPFFGKKTSSLVQPELAPPSPGQAREETSLRTAELEAAHPPGALMASEIDDASTPSANARRRANEGRLEDAISWCERAIAADKMNPAHYYLLATVQREHGQAGAAAQSLRRALYLDPFFVLAHFSLANIELAKGRLGNAERHFMNALTSLKAHPHDQLLPEADGLTAGRLTEIITSILETFPSAGEPTAARSLR